MWEIDQHLASCGMAGGRPGGSFRSNGFYRRHVTKNEIPSLTVLLGLLPVATSETLTLELPNVALDKVSYQFVDLSVGSAQPVTSV